MKLTIAEIFNAKEPLEELTKSKFPVKTSLSLLKLVRKLNEHLIPAEQVKDGLIKTYGAPDPANPHNLQIKQGDKNWQKFAEEYGELVAQEVEVVFSEIQLPDTLEIEPAILMALEKFIKV
uniref:Uncharacterized protein n=1 Tax=viral metagenome TaxID=1070528 RepID=A0A6M3L2E8_9ZZZZ